MAFRIFNSLNQPITLDFGSYDFRVEPLSEAILNQEEFDSEEYKKNSADLHLLEKISDDVVDNRVPEMQPVLEVPIEAEPVAEVIENDIQADVAQLATKSKKKR